MSESSILFTPAAVLDLLSSIDELQDVEVGITETLDGNIQCQVGNSFYEIRQEDAEEVQVDESVAEQVEDINETAYENLDEDYDRSQQPIESGIIKEALKTLMIGGMVRLGAKWLKK